MNSTPRFRFVATLIAGMAIGSLLLSPVAAHVGDQVTHLWSDHIRPRVKDDFYTQGQSDARFLRKKTVRKGFFSCPSTAWYPEDGDETYWTTDSGKRYSTTDITSFHCNAVLPHGAKVVSTRFSLYDAKDPDFVTCALLRRNLEDHGEVGMATGQSGPSVGDSIQTDTSISKPTVNNNRFTYSLTCINFGPTENTGFYGASVGYELNGLAGVSN